MAERWNGEDDVVANESLPREGEVPEPVRDERGQWVKGTPSPNPGGYRKADRLAHQDVREAAKEYTPQALKTLANIMNNAKRRLRPGAGGGGAARSRLGQAVQPVSGDSDSPLVVEIIQRVREPKP